MHAQEENTRFFEYFRAILKKTSERLDEGGFYNLINYLPKLIPQMVAHADSQMKDFCLGSFYTSDKLVLFILHDILHQKNSKNKTVEQLTDQIQQRALQLAICAQIEPQTMMAKFKFAQAHESAKLKKSNQVIADIEAMAQPHIEQMKLRVKEQEAELTAQLTAIRKQLTMWGEPTDGDGPADSQPNSTPSNQL